MSFSKSKLVSEQYEKIDPSKIENLLIEFSILLDIKFSKEMMNFLLFNPIKIKYESLNSSLKTVKSLNSENKQLNGLLQYFLAREMIDFIDPKYHILSDITELPNEYKTISKVGAHGLFYFGFEQFKALKIHCESIVEFIIENEYKNVSLIESPLGNVVPIQILDHLLKNNGVNTTIVSLSLPRNEKASLGLTLKKVINENIDVMTKGKDLVVYIDDIISGTRFKKTFKELNKAINKTSTKFLPCALVFKPILTTHYKEKEEYKRNKKSIRDSLKKIFRHYTFNAWFEMPKLPHIEIDQGLPITYESPVIWGEQPLVAGKKKVNFVFNIIEQFEGILNDLSSDKQDYRDKLELLWREDIKGQKFRIAPGVTKKVFVKIHNNMDWDKVRDDTKIEFEHDYNGNVNTFDKTDVINRMEWIEKKVYKIVEEKLNDSNANILIRAFNDLFNYEKNYYPTHRDYSYCNYFLEYNKDIRRLNEKLVNLIINI